MWSRPGRVAAALAGLTALLYAFALDDSPPHLHPAEALFALHAHAIATTGRDLYGRLMPLYFQMQPLGENTWWHPALVYLTALWLFVAPFTETMVRMPSVLIGALNVALVFEIARRFFGGDARPAALAAMLLVLTPSHFMQSRIAMDYIYPVPFVLGWLLCLLLFRERRHAGWLFAATSLLGAGVYSYIASVIMMPVYMLVTAGVLVAMRTWDPRVWAIAAAGFLWPLVLIPLWLWWHPEVLGGTITRYGAGAAVPLDGRAAGLTVAQALEELRKPQYFVSLPGRLSLYWYFFDPSYLFVTGGYASPINSTRFVGVFTLPLLLFLPLGLWRAATRPQWGSTLAAVGFLTSPIAAVVAVPEPYAVDRQMAVVAFGALVATYGVVHAWSSPARWIRRAATVLLLIVPLHFGGFLYEYFGDYRQRASFWFGLNHRGALEAVVEADRALPAPAVYLSVRYDPFMETYWQFTTAKWNRRELLERTVTFEDALDLAQVPSGSLLVLNRNDRALQDLLAHPEIALVADVPEIADPQEHWVVRRM